MLRCKRTDPKQTGYQEMMGLRAVLLEILRPLTTGVLRLMSFATGPESVIEDAAIRHMHLHRAGWMLDGRVVSIY